METILEKIEKIILYATVFLVPLVVLPTFPNPLSEAKKISPQKLKQYRFIINRP